MLVKVLEANKEIKSWWNSSESQTTLCIPRLNQMFSQWLIPNVTAHFTRLLLMFSAHPPLSIDSYPLYPLISIDALRLQTVTFLDSKLSDLVFEIQPRGARRSNSLELPVTGNKSRQQCQQISNISNKIKQISKP